jgi:hypothetical protein
MMYEIWSGNRYRFNAGTQEDPYEAAKGVDNARIIQVEKGVRTELPKTRKPMESLAD